MRFLDRGVLLFVWLVVSLPPQLSAQEILGSTQEQYNDYLALQGGLVRPTLNFRTLSDSRWAGSEEAVRFYGPDVETSYNEATPYGQNDGALWQGMGLNTSLKAGIRFVGWGWELTLLPQLVASQNLAFNILPSAYPNPYGYFWSLGTGAGADAPQRFGNEPVYGASWGDSEVRYTWKSLTLGFGTQSPWVGPGRINSLIHSNNAPPYPKIDWGFRKTNVELWGWDAGFIEARMWAGMLTESQYFDSDPTDNHNLISGLAFSYAPSWLPGLNLSINRTILAPWTMASLGTLPKLLLINFNGIGGEDVWDQRFALGFDYLLAVAGVEVYGEVGWNDYPAQNLLGILRNFEHTAVYTGGLRKAVDVLFDLKGQLTFEWTDLEMSPSYTQFTNASSYYMHYQIRQGYTNEGQWLGAGNGTGGNSQYLGLQVFYPQGSTTLYAHRANPDNDFIYRLTIKTTSTGGVYDMASFKSILAIGTSTIWHLGPDWDIRLGGAFMQVENPTYHGDWYIPTLVNGFRLEAGLAWKH